ncbi:MAG: ATP-binding protein [Endomicrobia bacterium]|nr:ATP-binding protein [Endomicrobiia bacterium]
MTEELDKVVKQEKEKITRIRQRIQNLTEEIKQKKNDLSTQLLGVNTEVSSTSGIVSPSLFSEIQNMLLETITKGYETIIQEKEKIIQKLQKEVDNVMEKYHQLKLTQEQQSVRISTLSAQQDKSLLDLVKKIAELESENRSLKEKLYEFTIQEKKTEKDIQQERIKCVYSHINLLSTVMVECLRYFRNPIGILNEAIELVKEDIDGHPANKKILLIQQEMLKIRDIIYQTGQRLKLPPSVQIQKVNLKSIMSKIVSQFQNTFVEKNIEVIQEYPSEDIVAEVDTVLFSDSIVEIIVNSIEAFLQPVGNRIIIKIDQSNEKVVIIIEDNGCGMPEHLLPKVFNLFFTTKFEQGHFGIGLFKTKWLLKMFGGEIVINSVYNKGTTVKVELPAPKE